MWQKRPTTSKSSPQNGHKYSAFKSSSVLVSSYRSSTTNQQKIQKKSSFQTPSLTKLRTLQKKWKILNKPDPSSFVLGCDGSCFCAFRKGGREIEMANPLSFHKNQSHQVDNKGPLNMVVLGSIHAPSALSPLQMMIVSSLDNKSLVLGRWRTIAFGSSVVVLVSLLNLHNPIRVSYGWGGDWETGCWVSTRHRF